MSDNQENPATSDAIQIDPRKRLIIVLGLIAAISFVAWVLSGDNGGTTAAPETPSVSAAGSVSLTAIPATIVSVDELMSATKDLGFPIYWNGKMKGTNIELTVLTEGKVYVRYLPKDVEAGSQDPYLTVATYYDTDAIGRVQSLGSTTGAKYVNYKGGAVAASASESDSNIYFAFPGNPALYNIYSPDPKIAWDSLDSGTIKILQ